MALQCNRCQTPMDVDVPMCQVCSDTMAAYMKPSALHPLTNLPAPAGTGVTEEVLQRWENRGVIRRIKLCDCDNAIDNLRERVARLEVYLREPDFDIDLDALPHELEDK